MLTKNYTPGTKYQINDNSQTTSLPIGPVYAGIYKSNKGPLSYTFNTPSQLLTFSGKEDPSVSKGIDSLNDLLSESSNVLALRVVRPYDITTGLVYQVQATTPFSVAASYQIGSVVNFGGSDYTLKVRYIAGSIAVGAELAYLTNTGNAYSGIFGAAGADLSVATNFSQIPLVPTGSLIDKYSDNVSLSVGDYVYDPLSVKGDAYAYIAYDNNLGWIEPDTYSSVHYTLGNLSDYAFQQNEAFIIASLGHGSFYNQYSVSIEPSKVKGFYYIRVYSQNLVMQEEYEVSFKIGADTSSMMDFAETVINPTSKLIQIKCNYTELERVEGVINESFFYDKLPTTVGQTNFINNTTGQFVGYTSCTDTLGNIYVTGGFTQAATSPDFLTNVANSFNEIVYQYNVASNTWISLPNNSPTFSSTYSFLSIGAVSVFSPVSNSILFFSTTNIANNIQAFEYSLLTYSWTNLGVIEDSTAIGTPFDPTVIGTGILTDTPSAIYKNGKVFLSVFVPGSLNYLLPYERATNSIDLPISVPATVPTPATRDIVAPELIEYGQYVLLTGPSTGNIYLGAFNSSNSSISVSGTPVVSLVGLNFKHALFSLDSSGVLSILARDSVNSHNEYREVNLNSGDISAATDYSLLSSMSFGSAYPINSIVKDPITNSAYILKTAYVAGSLASDQQISEFLTTFSNASPVSSLNVNYSPIMNYMALGAGASYQPAKSGQSISRNGSIYNFSGVDSTPFYSMFRLVTSHGGKKKLKLGKDLAMSDLSDLDVINTLEELKDKNQYGQIDLLVDCGFNSQAMHLKFVEVGMDRQDTHVILSMPEAYQYDENAAVQYRQTLNVDTYYATLVTPGYHIRINNFNGNLSRVPISGAIGVNCITNDSLNGPWQSPAGPSNGLVTRAVKLPPKDPLIPLAVTYKEISYDNTDVLGANNISMVGRYNRNFPGIYLKSDYTMYSKDSPLQSISMSRTTTYIASQCAMLATQFLYKPNNSQTRTVVTEYYKRFLKEIASNYGSIESFKVICDTSNNDNVMIDNNILAVTIEFVFVGLIKSIVLSVNVDNLESSVSVSMG